MFKKRTTILSLFISVVILSLNILSCGSPRGDNDEQSLRSEGETFDTINRISESSSSEKRMEAINEVAQQGRSLGLLDENGQQLNPNVSDDAISLTPEDIASFSTFVEIGHYTTVGDVIGYLAEVGVVLSETGTVINPSDFLPDLQDYVDWSFRNGDDPDSQLGIMLGSGPEMMTPASPPDMETGTQISPMAAVMMLGDILVGTGGSIEKPSAGLFTNVARAADIQETAERIKGLITQIESMAKPANFTLSFLHKAGKLTGLIEDVKEPTPQIKIPDAAKKIIGAFALGSHFAVRLHTLEPGSSTKPENIPILKSLELDQVGGSRIIIATLVLVSSDENAPVVLVDDQIPIVFSLRLLSPFEIGVGTDLYPDANAVLAGSNYIEARAAGGHILDLASDNSVFFEGSFTIKATKLDNKESRVALLYASASILTGDLGAQFEKYRKQYSGTISALGLKPEDLAEMFSVMKTAVKVSPWVAQVVLVGGKQVTLEPDKLTGKPNQGYTFTASIDDQPAGSRWEWEAFLEQKGQNPKRIDTSMNKGNVALISFSEPGEYVVTVVLWDGSTSEAKVISSASSRVTIEPEPTDTPEIEVSIEVNKEPPYEGDCSYLFTARPSVENEVLPENIRWEWYWGDGGEDVRKGQPHANRLEHMIAHTYVVHGNFTILVKLFNDNTNILLATADMPVNIDNLGAIQRTRWARVNLWAGTLEEVSRNRDGQWVVTGNDRASFGIRGLGSKDQQARMEWNGREFTITWESGDGGSGVTKFTITGKVSEDASLLETITTEQFYEDTVRSYTDRKILVLNNVPLQKGNCGDSVVFRATITGADEVRKYVTSYQYEQKTTEQITKFTGFDWNYTDQYYSPESVKIEIEISAME